MGLFSERTTVKKSEGIKLPTCLIFTLLFFLHQNAFADLPYVDLVRVLKSERKLQLLNANRVLHQFPIALGGNPVGHKRREGDEKTPEGSYVLDFKKANSAFYKAIHISYPNPKDRAFAQKHGYSAGGNIMIHGQKNGFGWTSFLTQSFDWTNGCIALTNKDMDEVWESVTVGTPIEILP